MYQSVTNVVSLLITFVSRKGTARSVSSSIVNWMFGWWLLKVVRVSCILSAGTMHTMSSTYFLQKGKVKVKLEIQSSKTSSMTYCANMGEMIDPIGVPVNCL